MQKAVKRPLASLARPPARCRRLPFSPWANQTELWEGHPRLWCLCRRGNSSWQLLAFRQQPVFMEIILPPYSGRTRLPLIAAWMKKQKTKPCFAFSCSLFTFFFTWHTSSQNIYNINIFKYKIFTYIYTADICFPRIGCMCRAVFSLWRLRNSPPSLYFWNHF